VLDLPRHLACALGSDVVVPHGSVAIGYRRRRGPRAQNLAAGTASRPPLGHNLSYRRVVFRLGEGFERRRPGAGEAAGHLPGSSRQPSQRRSSSASSLRLAPSSRLPGTSAAVSIRASTVLGLLTYRVPSVAAVAASPSRPDALAHRCSPAPAPAHSSTPGPAVVTPASAARRARSTPLAAGLSPTDPGSLPLTPVECAPPPGALSGSSSSRAGTARRPALIRADLELEVHRWRWRFPSGRRRRPRRFSSTAEQAHQSPSLMSLDRSPQWGALAGCHLSRPCRTRCQGAR